MFRWKQTEDGRWVGVDGEAWYIVEIEPVGGEKFLYRIQTNADQTAFERLFRLEVRLEQVESEIVRAAPELKPYIHGLGGLRCMRPSSAHEEAFCFLCTPNNHMSRILTMCRALGAYGQPLPQAPGPWATRFPSVDRIATIPDEELRAKGFGYRGSTIPAIARQMTGLGGKAWLESFKSKSYQESHTALRTLKGIGPKLADCIALFALGHMEATPVDTHLWQAAVRLYFPQWRGKPLTGARYQVVSDLFRGKFGDLSGWAHQYLFYDNLLRSRMGRVAKLDMAGEMKGVP